MFSMGHKFIMRMPVKGMVITIINNGSWYLHGGSAAWRVSVHVMVGEIRMDKIRSFSSQERSS